MKPYDYLPEPPVNPPELSPEEEDRRERNYERQKGIKAINDLECLLYRIDGEEFFEVELARMRKKLQWEMED
jgi:hypothetical protein